MSGDSEAAAGTGRGDGAPGEVEAGAAVEPAWLWENTPLKWISFQNPITNGRFRGTNPSING